MAKRTPLTTTTPLSSEILAWLWNEARSKGQENVRQADCARALNLQPSEVSRHINEVLIPKRLVARREHGRGFQFIAEPKGDLSWLQGREKARAKVRKARSAAKSNGEPCGSHLPVPKVAEFAVEADGEMLTVRAVDARTIARSEARKNKTAAKVRADRFVAVFRARCSQAPGFYGGAFPERSIEALSRVLKCLDDAEIKEPLWELWWEYEFAVAAYAHHMMPPVSKWYGTTATIRGRVGRFEWQLGYRPRDVKAARQLWERTAWSVKTRPQTAWELKLRHHRHEGEVLVWLFVAVLGFALKRLKEINLELDKKGRPIYRYMSAQTDMEDQNVSGKGYHEQVNWLISRHRSWGPVQQVQDWAPIWQKVDIKKFRKIVYRGTPVEPWDPSHRKYFDGLHGELE